MQPCPIKSRRSRPRAGRIFQCRLRSNRFQQPCLAVLRQAARNQIDQTDNPPFIVSSGVSVAIASAPSTIRVPSASGTPCDLLRADRKTPRHGVSFVFFAFRLAIGSVPNLTSTGSPQTRFWASSNFPPAVDTVEHTHDPLLETKKARQYPFAPCTGQ
jgi:hypothetical protein